MNVVEDLGTRSNRALCGFRFVRSIFNGSKILTMVALSYWSRRPLMLHMVLLSSSIS